MIPASQPFEARYRHGEKGQYHFTTKSVVAWDDEGYPLVVGRDGCRLERANGWSNFHDVGPASTAVIGALPGGGWVVEHRDDDGSTWATPLAAWLVLADGDVTPLDIDGSGHPDDPRSDSNFTRIYHPQHNVDPTDTQENPS